MKKNFIDCVANTRADFLRLVKSAPATIYEVYENTPNEFMENLFANAEFDFNLIRFDMSHHSAEGRERFCDINDFERQCYGLPPGTERKPLPFFTSFVVQIGPVDIAWTPDEGKRLIVRTIEDAEFIRRLNSGEL